MIQEPDGEPGDSLEQRDAEKIILATLAVELGVSLTPRSVALPEGVRVTVDGVADTPPILVEAWAHQGPPKSAQKAKVVTDALKLLWVDHVLFAGEARKILALSDTAAAGHFQGRSWMAAAFRDLGIEVGSSRFQTRSGRRSGVLRRDSSAEWRSGRARRARS